MFRLIFLVVGLLLVSFSSACADDSETWSKMLEGLKSQGYYDTALEYLDWMKSSPLCPSSLKKQLDYQIANTHLDAIEDGAMFLPRDEHMKRCREALEKYLSANPNGEFVFDAISTQGRLLMEEGRIDIARANAETTRDADREPLTKKAREAFKQALPFFEKADKLATEHAQKLQKAKQANPAAVKDDDLFAAYGRFLAGKILINLVKSDIAKTFPKGSKEYKDGLTEIAKNFAKLGSTYNEYSAGFEAKLYAAKAYRDLSDFKQARGILGELNVLQGDEFMKIRTESLLLALDMSLTERKPEFFADAVTRVRAWNDSASAVGKQSRDGQQIFLLGAKNLIAYSETVKDKRTEFDRAMREAGAFLRQVRSTYPPFAKEAQEILRVIGGVKINKSDPQTYDEAREFADDDWKDFVIAYQDLQDAKKPEDQKKFKVRLDEITKTCVASFNRAINMREEGTPINEVNAIRLNLARVYAIQGKALEAAILADYLAQRYPGDVEADKTAGLAVRLYRQVFVEDKRAGHDSSAVATRLMSLCDFILKRWEGKEVIGEVQLLQIDTAIENGNIEEAKKLLLQTPEGTPQRVTAELRIGQSLWNNYAAATRLPDDTEGKPDKKTLDAMVAEARKQFEKGLNDKIKLVESGTDKVDASAVISALLLGQLCMNINDAKAAIDWMTNKHVGPMTLMDNPPPGVVLDDTMKLTGTMTILRAYVATENLDLAEKTMDRLEALIKEQTATDSDDPEEKQAGQRRLTQIYVTLGRQLEGRLKELNEAGEFDQAAKVAKGFELFLTRIRERGDANSFQSLYWVADTFYRLGSGLTTEGKKPPSDAENYYKKAAATYVDIKKRLVDEPAWAPERAEKTIDVRLAESLRCIGRYENAMKFLANILEDDGNRIDTQIEAAKTLEAWGSEDIKKLYFAIGGRDPGPYVWGWNGLIKRTSADVERFGEVYYNSYLSKLRCCLAIFKAEADPAKKEKVLKGAFKDIAQLISTRPQLGGPELFAQFDQIYRNIQKAEGITKPQTLKEFQQEVATAVPEVHVVETPENAVVAEPLAKPLDKPKEKGQAAAAPTSDMTIWIALGATAVVCVPLIYVVTSRKKKPGPQAEKITIK